MDIFQQASILFLNMDLITIAFILVGLICVIGEIYQPGTKSLGAIGAICLFFSVLMRVLSAKQEENIFCIIFLLLAIFTVVILFAFIIMIRFVRYDWVNHIPYKNVEKEEVDKYRNLKGEEGITLTTLRPGGKAEICSAEYQVYADGFFINIGERIKVTKTEGEYIYVKKI